MSQNISNTHNHSTNPSLNDNQSKLDEFFINLANCQEPLGNHFTGLCTSSLRSVVSMTHYCCLYQSNHITYRIEL